MKTTCVVREREDSKGLFTIAGLQAVADRVVAAMGDEVDRFTCSAQENLGHLEEKVTALAQVFAAAAENGAFALNAGSNDDAVLSTFEGGSYSAQISGPANASGIVLVELYDANATTASRLVNVSARAQVGTGDNILVAAFFSGMWRNGSARMRGACGIGRKTGRNRG